HLCLYLLQLVSKILASFCCQFKTRLKARANESGQMSVHDLFGESRINTREPYCDELRVWHLVHLQLTEIEVNGGWTHSEGVHCRFIICLKLVARHSRNEGLKPPPERIAIQSFESVLIAKMRILVETKVLNPPSRKTAAHQELNLSVIVIGRP